MSDSIQVCIVVYRYSEKRNQVAGFPSSFGTDPEIAICKTGISESSGNLEEHPPFIKMGGKRYDRMEKVDLVCHPVM